LDVVGRRSSVVGRREVLAAGGCDVRYSKLKVASFLCRSSLSNFIKSTHQIDAKIERLLFSATTGAIFILKLACSPSDNRGLHASFRMKIALVVAENKSRSIWGWSIQPKRTVSRDEGRSKKKKVPVKNYSEALNVT
jgi:hypothetical protein